METESSSTGKSGWTKVARYLFRYDSTGEIFARFRVHGKIVRVATGQATVTNAKLRLRDIMKDEFDRSAQLDPSMNDVKTFGDALVVMKHRINNNVKLRPRGAEYKLATLDRIVRSWPNIEKLKLAAITETDCVEWAKRFAEKYSNSTYNHAVETFTRIMAIGVKAGAVRKNPFEAVDPSTGGRLIEKKPDDHKVPVLPEPDQWMAILAEADRPLGRASKPSAQLIRFLAFSGARIQEASRVTRKDVDLVKKQIRLTGKNGKTRWVPMNAEMEMLIADIFTERPKMSDDDRLMTVSECKKTLARCCKVAGCPRITHHTLRHLFATRCIESGVDIPTVAGYLGHSDGGALAMKVYGHLRMTHAHEMMRKVNFGTSSPQK